MPVHDWAPAPEYVFFNLHLGWITHLTRSLNMGILSEEHYALSNLVEELLTADGTKAGAQRGLGWKNRVFRRRIAIHQNSDDRIVSVIEIVTPSDKSSRGALHSFVNESRRLILGGVHLLIVDLLPPGKNDPRGVHPLIWERSHDNQTFTLPPDKPLTLASYHALPDVEAYIDPVAVGDELPTMPLFIGQNAYVLVPLETTYQQTFQAMPRQLRRFLET